jgi:hypothetical protein
VLFHHIAYFIPIFIRVFNFVHISDRFACLSRDYHRSFVLLVFCVSVAFLVIYTYLDCTTKLVLFGVDFSSVRAERR